MVLVKRKGRKGSGGEDEDVKEKIKCNEKPRRPTCYETMNHLLKDFTGYEFCEFNSFDKLIEFLHSPRDGSSLAVARIFFGLLMMIDIVEERSGFELDYRWGDDTSCRFTLFPFIRPLSMPRMGILYAIMWIGALGICLGYKYTKSCLMYVVPYWYLILLDKSVWNNHSYLFGLMGILFACSSANVCYSLDSHFQRSSSNNSNMRRSDKRRMINSNESPKDDDKDIDKVGEATLSDIPPSSAASVPFWNYFIIKFQYYILYTYAGLVKLSPEWLSGYAMTNLGNHWVFTPFRLVLGTAWTDLLIIHWFGCIFDLTIAFWLTHRRTRIIATAFAISFHLMNTRLFSIGMFPWVCFVHLPLFYADHWPRTVFGRRQINLIKLSPGDKEPGAAAPTRVDTNNGGRDLKEWREKRTTLLLGLYIFLQFFLPNSHFITRGYNNWTKGLYGYSWNMMVNSWQPIMTSITVVDNVNNKTFYLEPNAFTENSRWTRHADMAKQYAECIRRNMQKGVKENRRLKKEMRVSAENISIYFDVWCSMNSRFQQRVYDPRVDILTAEWSPFEDTKWVLPILSELTELRPKLSDITEHVFGWNNYSDVLFIADYPGLALDNYVAESADNVTLTILDGTVRLTYADSETTDMSSESSLQPSSPLPSPSTINPEPVILVGGQSTRVHKQRFHNVHVLGEKPASYMYTYTNSSAEGPLTAQEKTELPATSVDQTLLPLWDEAKERWNKFEMFFQHVLNSVLYEIYGVPMPRRVRTPQGSAE